ncbi:hypothetical protein SDRG_12101 [Saprolegnia diclina VS20]|uniref:Uncharacterized protein n=1 Tax=Saprolegnia diclina (strain VS20) TaxID=1156394 RepID=T0Q6L3_SAPDV|nr:hypothetical protein SDRG_12101 [Saprolegnia diclina VS20]EQC30251.1 hypothetical protein SDRG_12101 [Saprolegnia diclina VS20]|eukprot:XP_008616383.1 hypothetical protein SDRG_12101 [Saprolegnia diclina VS20]
MHMVCPPSTKPSGLKKLWTKVVHPFSHAVPAKEPPVKDTQAYICTCVQLNVLAARRRQAMAPPARAAATMAPIALPDEFRMEKKDKTLVSGHRVPYCPIQNQRWKSYRKARTFEAIAEDDDALDANQPIVCPGCMARSSLSTVTSHDLEDDY